MAEVRYGGAITWGSDPSREWAETELKAARLIGLASGKVRVEKGGMVSEQATSARARAARV
jgi:anthranilate/para-aminobenzoate synthase component I